MRRRDLLAVLGGAAVAAPVAARAQQKAMPVISYLAPDAPSASASGIAAWREGLAQSGFLEGRNVVVEYRSGSGDYGRMPALAAEFVAQHVDLIMAASLPAAVAAKSATPRMPIAFWVGVHPVAFGLVQSLNRPGGNLTGVTFLFNPLTEKRLQLLHDLVSDVISIGPVAQPKKPERRTERTACQIRSSSTRTGADRADCEQRRRDRGGFRDGPREGDWRPPHRRRPIVRQASRAARRAGRPLCGSRDVLQA